MGVFGGARSDFGRGVDVVWLAGRVDGQVYGGRLRRDVYACPNISIWKKLSSSISIDLSRVNVCASQAER